MIKCQRCSGVHEHAADCRLPSAVVAQIRYKNWQFLIAPDESYLQVRFLTADDGPWSGRKWRLSKHMTRSEIVQTAFMAALACEEHECRETFKYREQAVFGPHFNVEALVKLCEQGQLEVREVNYPEAG